jgi:hypothetical protein
LGTWDNSIFFTFWEIPIRWYYSFDLGMKDSDIVDKIVREEHKFPTDIIVSEACYKLLNGLLNKNIKQRLDMNDPLFETWYNDTNGSDSPVINTNSKQIDLSIQIRLDSPKKNTEKKANVKTPNAMTQNKLTMTNNLQSRSKSISIPKVGLTQPIIQKGSSKFVIKKK